MSITTDADLQDGAILADENLLSQKEIIKPKKFEKLAKSIGIGVGILGIGALVGVGSVFAAPVVIATLGLGTGSIVVGSIGTASLVASLQTAGAVGTLAVGTNVAVGTIATLAGTAAAGGILLATRKPSTRTQEIQTDRYWNDNVIESDMGPFIPDDDEDLLGLGKELEEIGIISSAIKSKATQTKLVTTRT